MLPPTSEVELGSPYTPPMRRLTLSLVVLLAACGASSQSIDDIPELPAVSTADLTSLLAGSDLPVIVNVWASWCTPCRSEAPLLAAAADEYGPEVRFVGLNVRDSQTQAREFVAEFYRGAAIENVYDREGGVPVDLGGSRAVPLTFFFAAGGELVVLHNGVIDERTLAIQIDELLRG